MRRGGSQVDTARTTGYATSTPDFSMSLPSQYRPSPRSGVRPRTRVLAAVVANGLSSEVRTFANLLAERDGTYDPLVLCHAEPNPHPKDVGAADDFERI